MERVIWDEKLNIGVKEVDQAHAKLFRIMNKLLEISESADENLKTYREGFKYLEAYSMKHFAEEEAFMRSIRYSGYARHKKLHDDFRDKALVSLKRELELSGYSWASVQRMIGTMRRWLTEHIMREDQAIVGRKVGPATPDLSSQIKVLSKVVNRACLDVFQVEAELISSEYKGENIGKAFYCRHGYDVDDGIRLQFLLSAEESLLLRGVNWRLDSEAAREEVTGNEALHIFWTLFQNLSRVFQVETEHKYGPDNLLDRNEYRAEFMRGYPCSLLFATRLGYLTLCYRSWRIREPRAADQELKKRKK